MSDGAVQTATLFAVSLLADPAPGAGEKGAAAALLRRDDVLIGIKQASVL